jgi:hypothetical protein
MKITGVSPWRKKDRSTSWTKGRGKLLLCVSIGIPLGPEAVEGNLGPNKIRLVRIEARAFNIHTAVGGNDWVAKECGHFLKGVLDVKHSK